MRLFCFHARGIGKAMLWVGFVRVRVFDLKCCGYASAPGPAATRKEEGGAVKISSGVFVFNIMVCGGVGTCEKRSLVDQRI